MKTLTLILLSTLTLCAANIIHDKQEISFRRGLEHYVKTRQKSEELSNVLASLNLPRLFRGTLPRAERDLVANLACGICEIGLGIAIEIYKNTDIDRDTIFELFVTICIWAGDEPEYCHSNVDQTLDIYLYAIDNNPNVTSYTFCSLNLRRYHCKNPNHVNWTVNIPPPLSLDNEVHYSQNEIKKPLKLLHLSDLHYDPGYGSGSDANCKGQLCCQAGSTPSTPEDAAGYWGHYNCDTPHQAIVDIFDHVTTQHSDVDFVYFTGDIIKHKDWANSISVNTDDITYIYQMFKDRFGNLPVYPVLGNHESFPEHQFSSEDISSSSELSTQWLLDLVAKIWLMWLPKATEQTILKGGYYTVLVKPGLRLIALNSNVAYTSNFWLLYDNVDPYGQLQWLVDTLADAEKNNELVHIIAHVPPSESDCFLNWAIEYRRVINRFSHIIPAQFTGHTHLDDTVIYFSAEDTTKAINVAFNGGSTTTFKDHNPNYKTYEIDPAAFNVINFDSWIYNVTAANLDPESPPKWYKLYDFKSAYNVTSLHPQNIAELVERMTKYPKLIQSYFRFKHRDGDTMMPQGCNSECELDNICLMVTSVYEDNYHCDIYTELYNNNRPS